MKNDLFNPRCLPKPNPYPMRMRFACARLPVVFLRRFMWPHPIAVDHLLGRISAEFTVRDGYCAQLLTRNVYGSTSASPPSGGEQCREQPRTKSGADDPRHGYPAQKLAH